MKKPNLFDRAVSTVETIAIYIAGAALALTMVIIVVDVVMRYLFSSPLGWSQEVVTYYFLPAAFFLSVSETLRKGGHVKISTLDNMVSTKTRWLMSLVGHICSALLVFGLVWASGNISLKHIVENNVYPGYILWPVWLSSILVPIGMLILELRLIQRITALIKFGLRHELDIVDAIEQTNSETNEVSGT